MTNSAPNGLIPADSITLAFIAACLPLNAYSQENSEQDSALETIVVTAQKRPQNLQEVPISVAVMNEQELVQTVIKDVFDLQTNIPGLQAFQSQSATNSSFAIRGVGTSGQNFGLESSVGLYVDGVYRARQNAIINNLVDIESVEVLRGPQGSLFGKNTPSGAIQIRSVAPSHDDNKGFAEINLGNFGLVNLSAANSFSIIDEVLAMRFTGYSSQRDGYVDDVALGDGVLNDRDRWGGRVQALYTPSDTLSVRLIADYSEIDEICCAAPVQLSNASALEVPGVFGSDALLPAFGGTVFSGDDFFDLRVALSRLPISTNRDRGFSAEIEYDLNGDYSIVAISGWRAFDSFDEIDADFTDADLFLNTNDATQRSFSQEVRLQFQGNRLNYVVGLYYFEQDLDLDFKLTTDSQFQAFFEAGLPPAAFDVLNGIDQLSALSGGAFAPSAPSTFNQFSFDHRAEQDHRSAAIFAQLDYQLSDSLTLTAGLRYTDEEKDLRTLFNENGANGERLDIVNPFPQLIDVGQSLSSFEALNLTFANAGTSLLNLQGALLSGAPVNPQDLANLVPLQNLGWGFYAIGPATTPREDLLTRLEDNQTTGTLKLSYQASPDAMYYLSYATGFKSGGTNTDRLDPAFDPVFDAETSAATEVGAKLDFPQQALRINAALHHTDVDDFQENVFTGLGFNLQNAGDLQTYGAEIELQWRPSELWLIDLAYAYIRAEYDEFQFGTCWTAFTFHTGIDDPGRRHPGDPFCNRAGDRVDGTPEHYGVLQLRRDFELSAGIYGFALLETSFSSDIILDGNNDPLKRQDDFTLINLRLGLTFDSYGFDLLLWGRNVTDRNVLGGASFDTPLQPGKLNAYTREPRTFGVTLRKSF